MGGLDDAIDPVGVRGRVTNWGTTQLGEIRGLSVFEDDEKG